MHRRHVLGVGGATAAALVAGCTGGDSPGYSTSGDDETPIDADPGTLLPSGSAIGRHLGGEWTESDPLEQSLITRTGDVARSYVSVGGDEHDGWITASAAVSESVAEARETFDGHAYRDGWGFETSAVAVESIVGSIDRNEAVVVFRDANAIGSIVRVDPDESGDPLEETTLGLAVTMHEPWRAD